MPLDFDVKAFVEHIQSLKPPYECPVKECGKIYKSFTGMQNHIYTYDHDNPENNTPNKKPGLHHRKKNQGHWRKINGSRPSSPAPELIKKSVRDPLTYAEAQRMVEVDLDGEIRRINICEPIDMISQDEIDNCDNTEKEELIEKAVQFEKSTKELPAGKDVKMDKPCEGKDSDEASKPLPENSVPKLPAASFKVRIQPLKG